MHSNLIRSQYHGNARMSKSTAQYLRKKNELYFGGCQIDATGLEIAGSFNLKSIVISTKLIKEILKNEGNESVWQQ